MGKSVDQYVYLVPQRDTQGTVTWMWLHGGKSGTDGIPQIVAEKGSGQNDITFTIADPQNTIKFAGYDGPNTAAAISIGEKSATNPPAKPTGIATGGEFKSINLVDATHLKLEDKNGKEAVFVYGLNFVDSQNPNLKITSIDPEIRNGDGGTVYSSEVIFTGVITAVATALLVLLFVRFALGWRNVRV